MGDRGSPLVSITVRRLVLPEGGHAPTLRDDIAAALGRRLRVQTPPSAAEPGLAEAVAQGIADHPELASLAAGRKRT